MKLICNRLPPRAEMVRAMLERDQAYEGVFFTAVRTTGIFCRPSCPARKPRPENVDFYATASDALAAGFRPCARCKPLQLAGSAPPWVQSLMHAVDAAPEQRWSDERLCQLGIEPARVRRWFKQAFGMTFHSFLRTRRLGVALDRLANGASIDNTAMELGYESISGFRDAFQKAFDATPGKRSALKSLVFSRIETPLGPMLGMAEERGLVLLEFTDRPALPREIEELRHRYGYNLLPNHHPHLQRVEAELRAYFSGKLREFSVPICSPGTPFDLLVWRALQQIPFGTTCSYGNLANQLGKPSAARAVGAANGRNRIAIVIPCHRICGANGELTGYGGGQPRKQWLLDHERRVSGIGYKERALTAEVPPNAPLVSTASWQVTLDS
jgi:AraC family transcriptional regulator of adaptative response/methylated-DNA-[protein]-cysteine methyltransferase